MVVWRTEGKANSNGERTMRHSGHQTYLTDRSFEHEILRSRLPLLVEFWAKWSGGCHIMAPIVDSLRDSLAGRITLMHMNIDLCPRTARRFCVHTVPTLLLFRRGTLVDSISGIVPRSVLFQQVVRNLDAPDAATFIPRADESRNAPQQQYENES